MSESLRITSVVFRNYKALKNYSVSLNEFNILVGPNNSGKSTIISAFRLLAEGLRKASSRNPELVNLKTEQSFGYQVPLDDLPVATENVFSDYDDSQPATIEFRVSNGNKLSLVFPEENLCYLVCKPKNKPIRTTSEFKRQYNLSIGFVPVLGPVEHNEYLFQKDTARRTLLTHRASRNFRNIWYHYPEHFDDFRELIKSTWPGMDIELPKVDNSHDKPILHMFCPEGRVPREIFWAGFGFQVWCQMLTYILRSKDDSLLIIDEPDIYLHSDLQRQLFTLVKNLGPDVIMATHSTEIISEADQGDLLIIKKRATSAKGISDLSQLQTVFGILGSNLNPTLTQLAKSKRAVFVEGKDFQILSAFAHKLKYQEVANRSEFAVIPIEGFNPQKVADFSKGIEMTLGGKILKAVILDKDYRPESEIEATRLFLNTFVSLSHIHSRKELENYLLDPSVIERALDRKIADYNNRNESLLRREDSVEDIIKSLTEPLRSKVSAQYLSKGLTYEKPRNSKLDESTITQKLIEQFDKSWNSLPERLSIIPGKELMAELNTYFQEHYKVSLTAKFIINEMRSGEVPQEIVKLIQELDDFQKQKI